MNQDTNIEKPLSETARSEPTAAAALVQVNNQTIRRASSLPESKTGTLSYGSVDPTTRVIRKRHHSWPVSPRDDGLRDKTPLPQIRRPSLLSRFTSHLPVLVLGIFTSAWVAFTIFFAYNCSLEVPLSQKLIFSKPGNTILTIAILSQFTITLIAQLTNNVLETVRWALASKQGIPALSFFALGNPTTYLGVLMISLHRFKKRLPGSRPQRHTFVTLPEIWGIQRYDLIREPTLT
jgi:hypothetical protein